LPPETSVTDSALYGWDWTATTHEGRAGVVDDLLRAMDAKIALPGKGIQGWSQSADGYDADGFLLGRVYFGGGRDDVHVLSTSEWADQTRPRVVGMDRARTARVDTRVDTLLSFEELAGELAAAADSYGSRLTWVESSERGRSLGRTLYLGAPSSAVRVRVYEKWLESPDQYVEGTNRVEVQLRPASKVKERVSSWSPAETFCASRVTRDLAQRLGDQLAPKMTLHVKRDTPDLERTLRVMGEQYGNAVEKWLRVSGGDVGRVVDYLTSREESAPVASGRPSSPDLWARALG
jgi:Replication initiation factor